MGKKYRNPPITEALCEFQFKPDSPWDLAVPGLIYERVKDTFRKRLQRKTTPSRDKLAGAACIRFLREDGRAFIQLSPQLLIVGHLKPYSSWQEFFPVIRQGFQAYTDTVNPTGLHCIRLRYINRIEIPEKRLRVQDVLSFHLSVGSDLRRDFDHFLVEVHVPFENSRDRLRLRLATTESMSPPAIGLDIEYCLAKPGEVSPDGVFEWINSGHEQAKAAFEACIKDPLRRLFEEVQ
jgi:uncharacterized protein (TIGR04255 family)